MASLELTRWGFQLRYPDGRLGEDVWSQRFKAQAALDEVNAGGDISPGTAPDRIIASGDTSQDAEPLDFDNP